MTKKTDPWVEEFRSQIALAESIWKSDILGKERLAFILLDNSIEFMSKYYLEVVQKKVGKGKNKIQPNDWADITRYFSNLMNAMKRHSPLNHDTIDLIERYHDGRNKLYHSSVPMAVNRSVFLDELKNAIEVFEVLFDARYVSYLIDVDAVIHGKPVLEDIAEVVGNNQIRIIFDGEWDLSQWVRVIINGYVSKLGITPTVEQIEHSLALSHTATEMSRIKASLRKLKYDEDIKIKGENHYSLTKSGYKKTLKMR